MNNKHVNKQIKSPFVFLVLPDGSTINNIKIEEAIKKAEELGLDLIQVSEGSLNFLPVCKVEDYGKIKYLESKKKKNIHHEVEKEIQVKYNISKHDLEVKFRKIDEFLSKNYKVRVVFDYKKARAISMKSRIDHFNSSMERFVEFMNTKVDVRGNIISIMLSNKK